MFFFQDICPEKMCSVTICRKDKKKKRKKKITKKNNPQPRKKKMASLHSATASALLDAVQAFEKDSPFYGTPGLAAVKTHLGKIVRACAKKVIVMTGRPGCGKSTTAKQLIGLDPESDEFKSFPVASGNGTGIPQKSSKVPIRYSWSPVYYIKTATLDGTETFESCLDKEAFYEAAKLVLANPDKLLEVIFRGPWAFPENTELVDCPSSYCGVRNDDEPLSAQRLKRAMSKVDVVVLLDARVPGPAMIEDLLSDPECRTAVPVFGLFETDSVPADETLAQARDNVSVACSLPLLVREGFAERAVVWSRSHEFAEFWPRIQAAHDANLKGRIDFAADLCKSLAEHREDDLALEWIATRVQDHVDCSLPTLAASIYGDTPTLQAVKAQLRKKGSIFVDVSTFQQEIADLIFDELPNKLNYGPAFSGPALRLELGDEMCAELDRMAAGNYEPILNPLAARIFRNRVELHFAQIAFNVQTEIFEVLGDFCSKDRSSLAKRWKVPEADAVAKLVAVCDRVLGQEEEETGQPPAKKARV
jgi:energy-coupling factor transporter ATP-binding protein EcfA2